jgi:hypothetical protein
MTEPRDPIERALELFVFGPIGASLYVKDVAPTFIDMFVARGRAEVDRRQEQVQQRVTTARSLGQVAMAFGPPMVRARVQRQVDDLRTRAEDLLGTTSPVRSAAPAASAQPAEAPAAVTPLTSVPTAEDPPVPVPPEPPTPPEPPMPPPPPDPTPVPQAPTPPPTTSFAPTTSTSASPTFDRPPVQNGAASAGEDLPIPGYDALSASQVVERLIGLSGGELDVVRTYETAHRNRRTILGKIEQLTA